MIGFSDMPLVIEKAIETNSRSIPTSYSQPITVYGYMVEKTTYNYQTGETGTYMFITLPETNLVSKEDKINGYRVETVKNIFIDGEFIVCEVTAK